MPAAAKRRMPNYEPDATVKPRTGGWRRYELRHRYPNGVRAVGILLNGDQPALEFARLVQNGLGVEVWDGQRLVGIV